MRVDGAAYPAEPNGGLGGRVEVGAVGDPNERVQVRVAERAHVDRALDIVETPGEAALQRDRQREERVGDAGISPVEQEVATIADEDLAVVEIDVLNCFREAVAGLLVAHLPHPRHVPFEASAVV